MKRFAAVALFVSAAMATDSGWTVPVEVRKGKEVAVAYRAALSGDYLLIEARHAPGWHTYALDNAARAKKKTGTPPLGIEKSTRIAVQGGLAPIGKWRQSVPKDLSQPEIEWVTWGFEGTTYFASKVRRMGKADAVITINAQACKADACAMVDDAEIRIPAAAASIAGFDFSALVEEGRF
jgi:hypothetical protein